jgi:hypothetical protein
MAGLQQNISIPCRSHCNCLISIHKDNPTIWIPCGLYLCDRYCYQEGHWLYGTEDYCFPLLDHRVPSIRRYFLIAHAENIKYPPGSP